MKDILVTPVRQQLAREQVQDVSAAVREGLQALPLAQAVQPGDRIAVAAGSRGISCLLPVVQTVVNALKAAGADPFLVPTMGSHGGGTAQGQRAVLEGYGLRPETLGVPILSDVEAVQIGATPQGMPVFFDRHAAGADGIVVVNRIKEHTAFKGRWESGLLKMLAVGLGKARGASEIHSRGLRRNIPAAARLILQKMPVVAGVGIVENGYHEPARIAVLPAARIEAQEPALLELARSLTPRIPIRPLDLLLVKEMGKDVSGTGMDLNVIGMWRRTGGPVEPRIETIAVLDLTDNSHGNAIGVGYADLICRRLRHKIDLEATVTNCLTARNLSGGKIPITLPTDRAVVEAGLGGAPVDQARLLLIRNTLELETVWASEALLSEVDADPALEIIGSPRALDFSAEGSLQWPAL
jgi:hypothetical protein